MPPEATIYHLTTPDAWTSARATGAYKAPSLETEGFIHCSTLTQLVETANRHYAGRSDLIVLALDVSLIQAEVRYEDTAGRGEAYPHIYGPLDLTAVRSVDEMPILPDGTFDMPPGLAVDELAREDAPEMPVLGESRLVQIVATTIDGEPHWSHPATLERADESIVITSTRAGLPIQRAAGPFTSPFHTRAHYWPDRWFNVIRLEEPGKGLTGYYCNIASPVEFDGFNVRYVDMQLDVRVYVAADGTLTYAVLDENDFAVARERYQYNEELVITCRLAIDEIIDLVEARAFPFDG